MKVSYVCDSEVHEKSVSMQLPAQEDLDKQCVWCTRFTTLQDAALSSTVATAVRYLDSVQHRVRVHFAGGDGAVVAGGGTVAAGGGGAVVAGGDGGTVAAAGGGAVVARGGAVVARGGGAVVAGGGGGAIVAGGGGAVVAGGSGGSGFCCCY
ncbi:hypothetical protein FHG87_011003 [Trinorchestia longiramus]|nr:hypothetical protein FHG87_011003 [Trinorchestia longiramus]